MNHGMALTAERDWVVMYLIFSTQLKMFNLTNLYQFEDEPWRVGDPFAYAPPKNNRHWEHVQSLGEKYDCEAWRDEIDKLLIFVG